jgi:hypothetical protein
MIKKWMCGLVAAGFFLSFSATAGEPNEILEQQSSGVRALVAQINKTIRARDPYSNPEGLFIMEGCYGGKKGDGFENSAVDVRALYYSELFKRNTKQVTRVHLLFKKPVSMGVAQNYVGDFVPFLRGRTPTQETKMTPTEATECTPKSGGLEKRFTKDYFIEFYYASAGSKLIQEARFWNGNYNN